LVVLIETWQLPHSLKPEKGVLLEFKDAEPLTSQTLALYSN